MQLLADLWEHPRRPRLVLLGRCGWAGVCGRARVCERGRGRRYLRGRVRAAVQTQARSAGGGAGGGGATVLRFCIAGLRPYR